MMTIGTIYLLQGPVLFLSLCEPFGSSSASSPLRMDRSGHRKESAVTAHFARWLSSRALTSGLAEGAWAPCLARSQMYFDP
jgi:hypothetical protein